MFLIINRHTGRYDWLMSIVGVWIVSAATKDTFSVGVVVDKDWLLHLATICWLFVDKLDAKCEEDIINLC